jgi:spheroidene monooxygenase
MGTARLDFARMPQVRFWKLCGSGTGQGFTPTPNTRVWAILAVWDTEETARYSVETAPVYRRWRARCSESWTVFLSTTSCRGEWSGRHPFKTMPQNATQRPAGPLAVLTRATIRPAALTQFWRREPGISLAIGDNADVIFKIGIGEVPWLHQVTFSIWPDAASMSSFAHDPKGPHSRAIQAVRSEGWFKEELYARFSVIGSTGTWEGTNPLHSFERTAA